MKISLVIPCYINHINNLINLLESLEFQTRPPDEVIISCSSTNDFIVLREYVFPVKMYIHKEKKNAAENRNIAASKIKEDTDIICFFDADDKMHPQRIELLEYIFNKGVGIILHNFASSEININDFMKSRKNIEDYGVVYDNLIQSPSGCAYHKIVYDNMPISIHHSQVSIRRELFYKVKFQEDISCQGSEDSLFCGDLLIIPNLKNAYIKEAMSVYEPSNSNYPESVL
jgi:glycosyltransferase involved in cell wall biosynthesis